MARKKNTKKIIEDEAETKLEEPVVVENLEEATLDDGDVIQADVTQKAEKRKMGASTGLLALLLAGVAGVFASPHIAPFMPNSIAQYLESGDGQGAQVATDAIAQATSEIAQVTDAVAQIEERLSGVETGLDTLAAQDYEAQINKQIADLKAEIDATPTVVTADGASIDLGPIQAELDALKAQNAELSTAIGEKLSRTVSEAEEQVATAENAKNSAAVTVALAQLRMSAMDGRGIADDLQRLREAEFDIPEELSNLSSGVDSAATLENEFGDYAISAIRSSIKASSGDQGGFFADVKSQISAEFAGRSTTPQEGVTPDAILSRSEDHLRNGNLEQSILELSALPSEAMDEMKPWIERAEKRLNLLAAIDALENSSAGN